MTRLPAMETPSVPPRDQIRFRARLRTRWSDEDNHGVVNNAVYLTLFEEARLAYFTELGAMNGRFFPFVLAQTNVGFLMPGRGGSEVEVDVATTHVGRTSLVQAYRVRCGEEIWCEAEARLVFTSELDTGKTPIPDDVRAGLEALERG